MMANELDPLTASLIPSSAPYEDAKLVASLFPYKYETKQNATPNVNNSDEQPLLNTIDNHCIALIGKKLNYGSIIFLKNDTTTTCRDCGQDNDEGNGTSIDTNSIRSILLLSENEMKVAFRKIDTLMLHERTFVLELDKAIILNLQGGSALLLVNINHGGNSANLVCRAIESIKTRKYTNYMKKKKEILLIEDEQSNSLPRPSTDFPTLSIDIFLNNTDNKVKGFANSQTGIPIDTEMFSGRILILIRPNSPLDDPHYYPRFFENRKRRFEIQFQGRIKRVPKGVVYGGAELTHQMKLGFIANGISNLLLRLLSKLTRDMHYSFGDKNNVENAHIVFPLWSFVDKLVITGPEESPPPLGEVFLESSKSISLRKNGSSKPDWNLGYTYSMSFNSMYLDFPTWKLVNLPIQNTSLHTFWGDSPIRISIYEKHIANETRHVHEKNDYFFIIQMNHISGQLSQENDEKELLDYNKNKANLSPAVLTLRQHHELESIDQSVELDEFNDDDDDTVYYDTEENHEVPIDDYPRKTLHQKIVYDTLRSIDLLCPGWIDIYRNKGRHYRLYNFRRRNRTYRQRGRALLTVRKIERLREVMMQRMVLNHSCTVKKNLCW